VPGGAIGDFVLSVPHANRFDTGSEYVAFFVKSQDNTVILGTAGSIIGEKLFIQGDYFSLESIRIRSAQEAAQ
jgi:hypothetical protein